MMNPVTKSQLKRLAKKLVMIGFLLFALYGIFQGMGPG